eukprot:11184890-Lingulodinium_polyedra.AAC.1
MDSNAAARGPRATVRKRTAAAFMLLVNCLQLLVRAGAASKLPQCFAANCVLTARNGLQAALAAPLNCLVASLRCL